MLQFVQFLYADVPRTGRQGTMKAAGAFLTRPRELRERHNMPQIHSS